MQFMNMLAELTNTNPAKKKWVGSVCSQFCAVSWDQINKIQIWGLFGEVPVMVCAGHACWTGSVKSLKSNRDGKRKRIMWPEMLEDRERGGG